MERPSASFCPFRGHCTASTISCGIVWNLELVALGSRLPSGFSGHSRAQGPSGCQRQKRQEQKGSKKVSAQSETRPNTRSCCK